MKASRRNVLAGLGGIAAAAATGLAAPWGEAATVGTLSGADAARGHRLREGNFPPPSETEEVGMLVAGGGIAGLSAAWTLAESGWEDFQLLELEDRTGGNARSGDSPISRYPLGAHYLPVANRESRALQHLLRRLGMIVGEKDGRPVYDPLQLCADLQERLFWQGRWQEGLVPQSGLSPHDQADLDAFATAMAEFQQRVGADGKPAFAVPIAYSSRDADLMALDRISFGRWIADQGWSSRVLLGHLRYCMRDDYGCEPGQVSAWAGIHYFSGRRGWAADGAADNLLTWPEGNDRLAAGMAAGFSDRIRTGRIVYRARRTEAGVEVDSFDTAAGRSIRTRAKAAILSMPHFVAQRVAPDEVPENPHFTYAPWIVANVTVGQPPSGRGAPLAWDNLSWTSESLGYVVATHQGPDAIPADTILTWYLPLSRLDPVEARRLMLERPVEDWQREVRDDLLRLHPDLDIRRIDIWRWGHGMIRPTPGFVWGAARAADQVQPPFFLAHSDLSGLSLFEEAHYRGTRAAEGAMTHVGHAHESLL